MGRRRARTEQNWERKCGWGFEPPSPAVLEPLIWVRHCNCIYDGGVDNQCFTRVPVAWNLYM